MTFRRQFLGAAAALIGLSESETMAGSTDEPVESASTCRDCSPAPLEDCFGTLDLLVHDEAIDVDVIAGAAEEVHDGEQAAVLRLRMDSGSLAVTLQQEDIHALNDEVDTAPDAASTS